MPTKALMNQIERLSKLIRLRPRKHCRSFQHDVGCAMYEMGWPGSANW